MTAPQSTYRIFVGAFPSGQIAERIQSVRMRWDPKTAQITPPHVTLAGTYVRSGPPTPGNEAESITRLGALHRSVHAFDLVINGVRTFHANDQPVIYLHIEPTAELLSARKAILDYLGPDRHNHFSPHLTLSMRLHGESARRALTTLQSSEWSSQRIAAPINELRLMQRGPADYVWRCIATFPLV